MTSDAERRAASWLRDAEALLTNPQSPACVDSAVERLELACRHWPLLLACVTDRAAWDSVAVQIRRLEQLADQAITSFAAADLIGRSARGYTKHGEPARAALRPASLDCRG